MGCCETGDDTKHRTREIVERRTVLKGMVGAFAGAVLATTGMASAQGRRVRLAFCSQLLCVVPYEFTRSRGFFEDEGLAVELIYTRGGNAALQALVGGAVEFAATSFDAALQAFANQAPIRRFATTGRLPLFALATSPRRAADLTSIEDLAGTTVGVSALGNADHVMMLYLLERAGVDPATVSFATLGVNLYEALRLNQVDTGWVQEPSLTLILEAGGRVLFNAMDIDQAQEFLGGTYEFMGVAVRADELEERHEEMRALSRALQRGLVALKEADPEEIVAALPGELIAGGDVEQLTAILARNVDSLYPDSVVIDVEAARRVLESQVIAGVISPDVDLDTLLATEVLDDDGG